MSLFHLRPRTSRCRALSLAAGFMVALTISACDAASDILGVTEPPPSSRTTQLTIWTSDPSPSSIGVVVDGRSLGTLTHYRSMAPSCGDRTPGATITVDLAAGEHVISAFEMTGSGEWGPSVVRLVGGTCLTYELMP